MVKLGYAQTYQHHRRLYRCYKGFVLRIGEREYILQYG